MIENLPQLDQTSEPTDRVTAFTSGAAGFAAGPGQQVHVSRQSSNPGRRKRTPQSPRRIQARDRREVRRAILHHLDGWKGCSDISLLGMRADRAEAGGALQFQSYEEKVFDPHQLLGSGSGDGCPGAPVVA